MKKIRSKIYKKREDLARVISILKISGRKIGLTNGTFDLLHAGHVAYLEKAKRTCDVLIVSINTDESVKTYKGSGRPVIQEKDRASVVAALQSVDYVTFHSERRMRKTLKLLKPHYYIKAGDYEVADLTSRDVLREWGGEVKIIPLLPGRSTSNIIQKILNAYGDVSVSIELKKDKKKSRAVILDRDGVINEEVEYLHEPEKFKFIPYALEGIKKMYDMGFKIAIATTQAGIGLGYFTKEDFFRVNKKMLEGFRKYRIVLSKIYFCPHAVSDNCKCRKPKNGLIQRARNDLNLDLSRSWVIGDKTTDILVGKKSGCHTILVRTGHGGKDQEFNVKPDFAARDLLKASDIIKRHLR